MREEDRFRNAMGTLYASVHAALQGERGCDARLAGDAFRLAAVQVTVQRLLFGRDGGANQRRSEYGDIDYLSPH